VRGARGRATAADAPPPPPPPRSNVPSPSFLSLLTARWLTGIKLFRASTDGATLAVVAAPASTAAASDYFPDLDAALRAAAVLAANVAVDGGRFWMHGSGSWGATLAAACLAAVAALAALVRAEALQLLFLKARFRPLALVTVGAGATAAAAAARAPAWLVPPFPVAAAAATLSRGLFAATEIDTQPSPTAVLILLAIPTGLAAALLAPVGARAARAADLACRPPPWGCDMLLASLPTRIILRVAMALPSVAVLCFVRPTAAVWAADAETADALSAASLIAAGVTALAASRGAAAGAAGAGLTLWWTRTHDAPATGAGAAAAAVRAAVVTRLAVGMLNLAVVKRAAEVAGAGLLLAAAGAAAAAAAACGRPSVAVAARWLGAWCATAWGGSLAWNLLLLRIGYLTDVPGGRGR
jgi:hypothetical protein